MNKTLSRAIATALLCGTVTLPALAGVVDPELQAELRKVSENQPVPVIIRMSDLPDLNGIRHPERRLRRAKMVQSLKDFAGAKQAKILRYLARRGISAKQLWIINAAVATVPARDVDALARLPGVSRIQLDATLSAPNPAVTALAAPEWNLSAVKAPDMWSLGFTGQGVVVANMDTGVDVAHPDLTSRWRGGSNSWYDPHGQHGTPVDINGHGTQTMGIMVGGDTGGSSVGMAPGARWIAVKVFNDAGAALESHFHLGFQWLLDPDGNPLTDDTPDVVNGSFETSLAGLCDSRFSTDIQNLKTAGVAVVFAAGNSGPAASSSVSPANAAVSFAAGAVDSTNAVASFSSRGPSACDGSLFPHLVAPGVNVLTTDLSFAGMGTYNFVTGTSFAAPHVAGGMALLLGAVPGTAPSALEQALTGSATDLGINGADNSFGHGLLNVQAAYNLLTGGGQAPVANADSYGVDEDSGLTVAAPGTLGNDTDPQSEPLTASLVTDASHGSLVLNSDGSFNYTPVANFSGADSFSYKASDGTHTSGTTTVSITVNPVNDAPSAQPDSFTLNQGATVNLTVVANDTDPDSVTLTSVIDAVPVHGSVSVNPDGTVRYVHDGTATTSDSFSYHVSDGQLSSAAATVSLTIDPVVSPVGSPDSYGTAEDITLNVTTPGVLANDTPANGLTAELVSGPAHSANFVLNADGSFGYTPTANYSGPDSFVYRAINGTARSGDITVVLTVNPVNDAPVALNDGPFAMISGQSVNGNVLGNDSDPEGGSLSAVLVSAPSAGSLVLNPDGSFSYDSTGVAAGSYSFSYRANDGGSANNLSNLATVGLTVAAPVNTAPVANTDTYLYRAGVTRGVNPAGVLANDADAEANPLSAQWIAGSLSGGGTLSFNADGSFTYLRSSASNASFRYRASDGLLLSSPATGTTVYLRSDAAPSAVADNCTYDRSAATVSNGDRCTVTGTRTVAMNLSANDTDSNVTTNVPVDGVGKTVVPGSLLITATTSGVYIPANGTCAQAALGSATNPRATVVNHCNGTVTVTMSSSNTGNIVYSYKISDDLGAQSSARQVTLSSVQ